jgi:hypothetical protein
MTAGIMFDNMVKEGRAEIPVAAVRPEDSRDAASHFPEELTGGVIVKTCSIERNFFSSRIKVKHIIVCMVRMPVYAAYAIACRADNGGVLLDKGTQIFHLCRYIGCSSSDFYKTILMISEDIIDISLVIF